MTPEQQLDADMLTIRRALHDNIEHSLCDRTAIRDAVVRIEKRLYVSDQNSEWAQLKSELLHEREIAELYGSQRDELSAKVARLYEELDSLKRDCEAKEAELREVRQQLQRLQDGKFTKEEIHSICHNLHGTVSAREFANGCTAEQEKLYGTAPDKERIHQLEQALLEISQAGYDMRLPATIREMADKALLEPSEGTTP